MKDILHIVWPIVIGAVIGYFTNYIAIKMLFRPRRKIMIGSFRVPFTPGIIPKNQPRIARAVGAVVSEQLLTGEDIARKVDESGLREKICDAVAGSLFTENESIDSIVEHYSAEGSMQSIDHKISLVISEKILHGLERMDFSAVIYKAAEDNFTDLLSNPMVRALIKPESLAAKLGAKLSEYINAHGMEIVLPRVYSEVTDFTAKPLAKNLESMHIEESTVRKLTAEGFDMLVRTQLPKLMEEINIKGIVEDKINGMDAAMLEQLLLSIMKKELQAIVNLGALLGGLIGILNIFV